MQGQFSVILLLTSSLSDHKVPNTLPCNTPSFRYVPLPHPTPQISMNNIVIVLQNNSIDTFKNQP